MSLPDQAYDGISRAQLDALYAYGAAGHAQATTIANKYRYVWEGFYYSIPPAFNGASVFMNNPRIMTNASIDDHILSILGKNIVSDNFYYVSVGTAANDLHLASTRVFTSLQQMMELYYVTTGTDLVVTKLATLQTGLSVSKSILNVLTEIQNLRNQYITTYNVGTFQLPATSGIDLTTYQNNYTAAANSFFNQFYGVTTSNTLAGQTGTVITNLANLKNKLNSLKNQVSGAPDLVVALTKVTKDLSSIGTNTENSSGLMSWLIDKYNTQSPTSDNLRNAGQVQDNIMAAITAAQSQNSDMTNQVQAYLFTFEQFYKSAAAVLTSINDIITRMARNISK